MTYVEALYSFESGRGKSIIKQNRQVAEQLKQSHSRYLYKASYFIIRFVPFDVIFDRILRRSQASTSIL